MMLCYEGDDFVDFKLSRCERVYFFLATTNNIFEILRVRLIELYSIVFDHKTQFDNVKVISNKSRILTVLLVLM